jgi:branched-chain amino acid aminotransferase
MISTQHKINITKTENSRLNEFDPENIQFGKVFSDHMFVADYKDGEWTNLAICPYKDIPLSPATSALHYGQALFEGLKAYKNLKGEVLTFRPLANAQRLNASADRLCMPHFPTDLFQEALFQLLELDKGWVPNKAGSSLYVRPFMFATDNYIGVKPSDTYKFIIFTCPVGAYYSKPVKVKVESFFSRACEGGVGRAKAAGNYAASLFPAIQAQKEGYDQLIWTDAKEHKYIEESGTMNIMFIVDNQIYTPTTSGTILPGITRDSVLRIARDWDMVVNETSIHVEELQRALKQGRVQEAFGTGTAATIARIDTISYDGVDYKLPPFTENDFAVRMGNYLEDLKRGNVEDNYTWVKKVCD